MDLTVHEYIQKPETLPGFGSKPIRHLALTYRIRLEGYLKERVRQSVNILGTLKYP